MKCNKVNCIYNTNNYCEILSSHDELVIQNSSCSFYKNRKNYILGIEKSRERINTLWSTEEGKLKLFNLVRSNPNLIKEPSFVDIISELKNYLRRYHIEFIPPKEF